MQTKLNSQPDKQGHFGVYGGMYVPETLMAPLQELTRAYEAARRDRKFRAELDGLWRDFCGRPNHFLVSSTHDSSGKLTVLGVPMDTNGLVMNVAEPIISVKHSKKVHDKVVQAKHLLSKTKEAWASFDDTVKKLINVRVTEEETHNFIKAVVGDKESTRSQNIRDKIYDITKTGISRFYPNCYGTLFGVVLACIEWADNHQTVRASKYCDETTAALNAKLVGDGAAKKAKAWGVALTMLRAKDKLKLSGNVA